MPNTIIKCAGLALTLSISAQANAHSGETSGAQTTAAATAMPARQGFEQFTPRPSGTRTTLDYSIWNEALKYFVMPMGRSLRESASRPAPGMGTRRVFGHDSRFRLEGNRVIFSYMTDEVITSFSEYRRDLESVADQVDIQSLSRNEQLAYWINLHNVAIVEQIALNYPIQQPSRIKLGESKLPLDTASFITVSGVTMSLSDIRTTIVFANWQDPNVIYAFFRGDIGGPSINREAYTGRNLSRLLGESAEDFINSLRGTQKSGNALLVSEIYEEARPYYFTDWPAGMRAHVRQHARAEVVSILDRTSEVRPTIYELDIADLANGERETTYNTVYSDGDVQSFRVPQSVQRLLGERAEKVQRLIKEQGNTGRVTIIDVELPGAETPEVK